MKEKKPSPNKLAKGILISSISHAGENSNTDVIATRYTRFVTPSSSSANHAAFSIGTETSAAVNQKFYPARMIMKMLFIGLAGRKLHSVCQPPNAASTSGTWTPPLTRSRNLRVMGFAFYCIPSAALEKRTDPKNPVFGGLARV